ncbi:MAG: UDP-N-acetylmuramate dehydrogenase [Candidatus Pacebacteria bacterium]|nr:UDP-N-acetylmuramate dehydrogenase [Candidatus Paceibacterota bacterium]
MKIQDNILLAPYTTFKIGGEARYFAIIKNIEDLKDGVNFALQNSLPFFILGGGSNILVSDDGFDGLVLKMEIKSIDFRYLEVKLPNEGGVEVVAGAGENWDDLVVSTVEKGLIGMENLSLIPGTVGASVVQNIGAFGVEVESLVSWVEVFDIETQKIKKLNNQECNFDYRTSLFKKSKNLIVLRVAFQFKKDAKLNFDYIGIEELLSKDKITVQDVRDVIIKIRKERYPNIKDIGTAGCFFQNPIITQDEFKELQKIFPDTPHYDISEKVKIPIAWFIDKFGWKGYRKGNVGVHKDHALILINYANASCEEVQNLTNEISKEILEKTKLKIEPEVVFLK